MRTLSGILPLLLAALGPWACQAHGHSHVEIVYRENQLQLVYYDFDSGEVTPDRAELHVGLPAARPVPDLPAYTRILGEAGVTTWILPEAQDGDLLWLGIGNGSLRPADFDGVLTLALQSVEGPGHFVVFQNNALGQPVTLMNSRDGIGSEDVMRLPLGSHIHCNWAFSAPGAYRVRLTAAGTLRASGQRVVSSPTDFRFEVAAPPPPVLALSLARKDTLQLTLQVHPGLNYRIESTSTFADWTTLVDLHAASSLVHLSLPLTAPSLRLFRARLR
jgi:surface-anchored protein